MAVVPQAAPTPQEAPRAAPASALPDGPPTSAPPPAAPPQAAPPRTAAPPAPPPPAPQAAPEAFSPLQLSDLDPFDDEDAALHAATTGHDATIADVPAWTAEVPEVPIRWELDQRGDLFEVASLEELHEWVADGRVERTDLVRPAGGIWCPAGQLEELTDAFHRQTPRTLNQLHVPDLVDLADDAQQDVTVESAAVHTEEVFASRDDATAEERGPARSPPILPPAVTPSALPEVLPELLDRIGPDGPRTPVPVERVVLPPRRKTPPPRPRPRTKKPRRNVSNTPWLVAVLVGSVALVAALAWGPVRGTTPDTIVLPAARVEAPPAVEAPAVAAPPAPSAPASADATQPAVPPSEAVAPEATAPPSPSAEAAQALRQGRVPEALAMAQQAIQAGQADHLTYLVAGQAMLELGRWKEAEHHLCKARALGGSPEVIDALLKDFELACPQEKARR